jgi:phage protein D
MDRSVLMDREEKLKDWPDKKDSDIASEIFQSHGLTPDVTETDVLHEEAVSTTIQRETDIRFLRRLALRNGFECFVEGTRGVFRPPALDAPPQPLLAAHFGDETTLVQFSLEVNALTPAEVSVVQLDRASKDVLRSDTTAASQRALGGSGAAALLGPGMRPGRVVLSRTAAVSLAEMSALGQSLFHRGEWFVTGTGEVAANAYGHVLRPRGTVTVKGIGETHSGLYYVGRVTHRFSQDGYVQAIQVRRNGLRPTGDEDFGGGAGGLF